MSGSTTPSLALDDIRDLLECEVIVDPGTVLSARVTVAGGADLMSDVLAFLNPGAVLLTGLRHAHSVRTAVVADAAAVIYVRGKRPESDGIELARQHAVPLLCTPLTMFEACGRLYQAGMRGCTLPGRSEDDHYEIHEGIRDHRR